MNRFLISALALLGSITASAAGDALNLTMKDGSVHSFLLSAKPVITMADGKLNVATDDATAVYDLHAVSQYAFSDGSTGIKGIGAANGITRNGDNIVFHGVSADKVVVSSADGALVGAAVSATGDDTTVSLSNLPSGIYIIKVAYTSIKISKK